MWNITTIDAVVLDKSCLKLFKCVIFRHRKLSKITDFFHFTILSTHVSLILHAKTQPKISSGSEEEVDFIVFAIFSNGGQLGHST